MTTLASLLICFVLCRYARAQQLLVGSRSAAQNYHHVRRLQQGLNVTLDYLTVPETYMMRAQIEYQIQQSGLSDIESGFLQDQLMPIAVRRVTRLLGLKRQVRGNLTLARICKQTAAWQYGQVGQVVSGPPQIVTCVQYYAPKCGPATIPSSYLRPARLCTTNGPDDCAALDAGQGVPSRDVVVFVTSASATACGTFGGLNQTAVGAYCYRDQYDRPIALNVNICPGTLQLASAGDLTSQRRDDLVAALVRALLQGLGADHALLPYFRDPVTNAPLVSRDANNEPTGATAAVYFQGVSGDGSTRVTKLVTPKALAAARAYLGCSTLDGVETSPLKLGSSTLFLADRIYRTELLAASSAPTRLEHLSNITLGMLYDSGWYIPNYGLASVPRFAAGAQCPISTYQCPATTTADPSSIPYPFCKYGGNPLAAKKCDLGRTAAISCPSASAPFDDGCFVQTTLDDAFLCGIPTQQLSGNARQRRTALESYGFSFGSNSICIENTLSQRRLSDSTPVSFSVEGAGCFRTRCSTATVNGVTRTNVEVFVSDPSSAQGGLWASCPTSGGVTTTPLTEAGFTSGRLGPCPDPAVICPRVSCPNSCSGNGDCDDASICRCAPGWAGSDCSRQECAVDSDCSLANQACDSTAGYCITAVPPPSPPSFPPPPPPPSSNSNILNGHGTAGGCPVLLDADGDGRQQSPTYDAGVVREVVSLSNSTGGFQLVYSGSFLRPGVLPRNVTLITMPGEPQLLVQVSNNCRDQYSGSLQWGTLRSLHVPQIFPGLTYPPISEAFIIAQKNPEIFATTPIDPLTTLTSEVYFLLVANYTRAGLIQTISRAEILSEASYRVAIAFDVLQLDNSFDLSNLNSSVIYQTVVRNGLVVQLATDLLDSVAFGKIDMIAALSNGYASFLPPYGIMSAINTVLSHVAAILSNATASTDAARVAFRAGAISLAEEIVTLGDAFVVPGLDESLLKAVVAAGGWPSVRPATKLAILIRSARRLDLAATDVVTRIMRRAASRLQLLSKPGIDADENRFYFAGSGLSASALLQAQRRSSPSARRLLQASGSGATTIDLAAPITASFVQMIMSTVARQPSVGASSDQHIDLILAATAVINQASTGAVATYMAQLQGGDISASTFSTVTSPDALSFLLEQRTAPGSTLASDADVSVALSGASPTPAPEPATAPRDQIQEMLFHYWWVAAGGLLLLVFLIAVIIWYANVRYRRRYKGSPKEEREEIAREEKRRRQEEDLLHPVHTTGEGTKEAASGYIPVKPQPAKAAAVIPSLLLTPIAQAPTATATTTTTTTTAVAVAAPPATNGYHGTAKQREEAAAAPAFRAIQEQPSTQGPEPERPSAAALSYQRSLDASAPSPVAYGTNKEPIYGLPAPPPAHQLQPLPPQLQQQQQMQQQMQPTPPGLRSKPPPDDFRIPAPPSLPPPPPPVLSLSTATTVVAATMLKLKARS